MMGIPPTKTRSHSSAGRGSQMPILAVSPSPKGQSANSASFSDCKPGDANDGDHQCHTAQQILMAMKIPPKSTR